MKTSKPIKHMMIYYMPHNYPNKPQYAICKVDGDFLNAINPTLNQTIPHINTTTDFIVDVQLIDNNSWPLP